jgi:hypothetical protein
LYSAITPIVFAGRSAHPSFLSLETIVTYKGTTASEFDRPSPNLSARRRLTTQQCRDACALTSLARFKRKSRPAIVSHA